LADPSYSISIYLSSLFVLSSVFIYICLLANENENNETTFTVQASRVSTYICTPSIQT